MIPLIGEQGFVNQHQLSAKEDWEDNRDAEDVRPRTTNEYREHRPEHENAERYPDPPRDLGVESLGCDDSTDGGENSTNPFRLSDLVIRWKDHSGFRYTGATSDQLLLHKTDHRLLIPVQTRDG